MNRWPQGRLGDLTDVLSGFAFDSEGFGDSGEMPVVRIRDVVPGSSSTFYRGAFDPRYIVTNGDILIGMDGEFNRARWRGGNALLNQRVSRIAPSCPDLDDGYLYYFLPAALKAIEQVTPFVTVKHLSVKQIRDIAIPLPPIPEQRRIAEILDKAEALRAKRRAALAQLDTLTQSVFLDMFGDPTTNSKQWPMRTLDELGADFRYGTSVKSSTMGKPTLRIPNVIGGSIDLSDLKLVPVTDEEFERLRLRDGDLLFVRTNGNPDFVGRCALFDGRQIRLFGLEVDQLIYASYLIRARIPQKEVEPVFLRDYLLGAEGRRRLRARCKTSAGQYNINTEGLGAIAVPLPAYNLQREFVKRVEAVERLRAMHRMAIGEIDLLFASLQHRAFRGEL